MCVISFWQRIRSLMKERRVSQAQLAEACGMSYNTFRKWISNNTIPPLDVASGLSRYFGVSLDYLAFGKETDINAKIGKIIDLLKKINIK